MQEKNVKAIIAIIIVGTFALVSAAVVIHSIVTEDPSDKYTDILKTFGSIYSGTVGLIFGYYFGQLKQR